MRIWIDASIPPPDATYHDWAMTGDDAVAIINSGKVSHLSIAYELDDHWTGYSLLLWMKQTRHWPTYGVHIHGGTKVQQEEMRDLARMRF